MAVQTEGVREIVDFEPEGALVTSFYLNVDATQFPSEDLMKTSFDSTIHEADSRRKEMEDGLSHVASESIRADLAKIRDFFDEGIDRRHTKGIAVFSCSARNFWEVLRMPMPVESAVHFWRRPYVAPIALFLSQTKPTAILVTDKQHARIFTMSGSEEREWTDFEDFVPRRSDQGGWSQSRYQRHSDNWKKHHLDRVAELVLRLLQHYPFDWLILGNEVQTEADLTADLHPYVKDRIIGHVHVRVDAPAEEIFRKARELRAETQGRYIDRLIEQVEEFAGAGGRGAVGLTDTVGALNEQKIHILLAQQGYTHPGAECTQCGLLMAESQGTCPACNGPANRLENVVDRVIQKSMELGSTVEVATEQDKLKPVGYIAAILYY